MRSQVKFAVMNWIAAVALVAFGALITYLGRNDPPQPVVLTVLLTAVFLGCPLVAVLTASVLMRHSTSRYSSTLIALNIAACVLFLALVAISWGAFGPNVEVTLGLCVLFAPFGINVYALYRHVDDPSGARTAEYVKRK
jgi:hypothetical protein